MTIDGNEEVVEVAEDVDTLKKETTVNLLNPTLGTTTVNGITCTNNGDGTYTLNGTANSTARFILKGGFNCSQFVGMKLVGCPSKAIVGGVRKFSIVMEGAASPWATHADDIGKGGSIIVGPSENSNLFIAVYEGATLDNLVFKPMITTNLDATYDDFVPYTGDTGKLNSDVADIKSIYSSNSVNLGRKTNSITGEKSSAFGESLIASGIYSHAEGYSTTASGESSHAEGKGTTASASYTHSEGVNTSAIGQGSHAEGSNLEQNRYNEIVFEDPRRAEVYDKDTGEFIFITVAGSQAFGLNSHAEGCSTLAYGKNSHTEGYHTVAAANESHAEGCGCEANASFAHAEGIDTEARGEGSHTEGFATTTSGSSSHAEGYYTKATNCASHASGKYNAAMTTGGNSSNTTGTAFVIGNGTGSSALSNAFSVQFDGTVKAKSTITASTTADYAEFFEWLDKNPNEEDRVGHFVVLDGDKIKIATDDDDYILGIVSGEPFVLGNGDCDTWNGMYLHDEFRRTMYEPAPKIIEVEDKEVIEEEYIDEETKEVKTREVEIVVGHHYEEVEGEYEGTRPILNPDYDPTQKYISRFDRVEWSPVGMLGVLAVLHDGTAEVNGYVTVNNEGIATKCARDTRNSYRVIKKVSDKVVEVIFR